MATLKDSVSRKEYTHTPHMHTYTHTNIYIQHRYTKTDKSQITHINIQKHKHMHCIHMYTHTHNHTKRRKANKPLSNHKIPVNDYLSTSFPGWASTSPSLHVTSRLSHPHSQLWSHDTLNSGDLRSAPKLLVTVWMVPV